MNDISTRALIATGIGLLVLAGVVGLIVVITGDEPTTSTLDLSVGSTTTDPGTTTTDPGTTTTDPNDTTTTNIESTTTTNPGATTTSEGGETTTTTFGVFDEVAAVEAFVEEFADAIDEGDVEFLYERLHPAVKATYEEDVCRDFIDDEILSLEDFRAIGPVTGPFDSEFGEFPVTTYEVMVAYTFDEADLESSASYSLTEGTVRWFAECES